MVELVRERAAELPQVEARVLDAQEPGLGDERFDAILCRLGFMLMPDPAKALRAARGLLGAGRVASRWPSGPRAGRNPWLSLLFDGVMAAVGAPPPEPGTPGPFALADHERLRGLLRDAGFGTIAIEEVERRGRATSRVDAWWADATEGAGPISAVMRTPAAGDARRGAGTRRRGGRAVRRRGRRAVPGRPRRRAGLRRLMEERLTVLDGGRELSFSFTDLLRHHGGGSPGGVAMAFKVLQRALPLLGRPWSAVRSRSAPPSAARAPATGSSS